MRAFPLRSSSTALGLASVLAFLSACPTTVSTAKAPAADASKKSAATAGTTTASAADGCDKASFILDPTTVVATVNGENLTYGDLGPEVIKAEQQALRDYCKAVYESRARALENAVVEKLLSKDAQAQGKTVDDYVKAIVDDAMKAEPSDADVQKFYDDNKREGMPPLEAIKPQVAAAVKQQAAKTAVTNLIENAKKGAKVVRKLPDVRPAPVDLSPAAHTFVAGNKTAKVQVVEFADFECPYCSVAADTMKQLKAKYGDKVGFSFRHFPLSFHPNAQKASEYAQCAGEQGKFWEMHDAIFSKQKAMTVADLDQHVTALGLDAAKLKTCIDSGKGAQEVAADLGKGNAVGVQGTPTFFINGRQHAGAPSVDALSQAIEAELN